LLSRVAVEVPELVFLEAVIPPPADPLPPPLFTKNTDPETPEPFAKFPGG